MLIKIISFFVSIFILSVVCFSQNTANYLIVQYDTTGKAKYGWVVINERGDTVIQLDTAKYYVCFTDTFQNFVVVGIKNKKGWWAIDRNEKQLFQVYNTSIGEASPDELRNGMIRIVDDKGRIGFANAKGEIVIIPQFEAVSTFYNGKAIIGKTCKEVLWCCKGDNADKHYTINCKQAGYINTKGEIEKISNQSFEQVKKEIGWKGEYDD